MRKILVIEDDTKLALALCVRLKANGYATWTASDATEGWTAALREMPDLIILDISLPAGSGLALTKELREHRETSRIPIIIATASAQSDLREVALKAGAAGLLRKPYDTRALLMSVQAVLGDGPYAMFQSLPRTASAPLTLKPGVKTVLIVEDDQRLAQAITLRMRAAGFDTTVAVDAPSAVRYAAQIEPDAVVLDISLPGGDGFLVAERIQANLHKPTSIVFLTASKRPGLREKARELGAVGFLEKPYQPEALLATVRSAVSRQASVTTCPQLALFPLRQRNA